MDFRFTEDDHTFRTHARTWLDTHLAETPAPTPRAWERELGQEGWIGLGWPEDGGAGYGNRTATLTQQVVWAEEYARSTAPTRMGHIGENLLAPTLITYGTEEQKRRHLPPSPGARRSGARGTANPAPGPTSPGYGPPPPRTAPARTP